MELRDEILFCLRSFIQPQLSKEILSYHTTSLLRIPGDTCKRSNSSTMLYHLESRDPKRGPIAGAPVNRSQEFNTLQVVNIEDLTFNHHSPQQDWTRYP